MNAVSVFGRHIWINVIELIRIPAYLFPTFVFPVMLFAFFAVPHARTQEIARILMASYAAYAVLGVTIFQFGVGIASERETSWEKFMRVLPVPTTLRLMARVSAAVPFSLATASLVILFASFTTLAHPSAWLILRLVAVLMVGAVPFALLGMSIGYWANSRAAVPIANLIYLPLSLGGGLWFPPRFLPKFVAVISPYLPTRHYGEVVWAATMGTQIPLASMLWLAGYTVLFAGIAFWGYRRDEGISFR